jgi:hypothetical protein
MLKIKMGLCWVCHVWSEVRMTHDDFTPWNRDVCPRCGLQGLTWYKFDIDGRVFVVDEQSYNFVGN